MLHVLLPSMERGDAPQSVTIVCGESAEDVKAMLEEIRRLAPAPQRVVFFRTESHALAFHVGRPLDILVQWPDLNARAAGSESREARRRTSTARACAW